MGAEIASSLCAHLFPLTHGVKDKFCTQLLSEYLRQEREALSSLRRAEHFFEEPAEPLPVLPLVFTHLCSLLVLTDLGKNRAMAKFCADLAASEPTWARC